MPSMDFILLSYLSYLTIYKIKTQVKITKLIILNVLGPIFKNCFVAYLGTVGRPTLFTNFNKTTLYLGLSNVH